MNNACTRQILQIARALKEDKSMRVIVIWGEGQKDTAVGIVANFDGCCLSNLVDNC